jgi:hypothetical protein
LLEPQAVNLVEGQGAEQIDSALEDHRHLSELLEDLVVVACRQRGIWGTPVSDESVVQATQHKFLEPYHKL